MFSLLKILKSSVVAIFLLSIIYDVSVNAQKTVITESDFRRLEGNWQGTLTYLDYSSNKPYTMPANVNIEEVGKDRELLFFYVYPGESNANDMDTLVLSEDGKKFNNAKVTSNRMLEKGDVEIITEEMGLDGNDHKKALLRHTYTIGKNILKLRKDVKFVGQKEWINRHEYSWTKI